MDYDDNDFQSPNLHLAGEGNDKYPPVLRPYALPRFDFDDNLHGHLRFDSLGETEVFLGIESSEDNQWIEDFSRGSSGIAFSSSATESCSISRRNNVWSEAASSESVEMLLKSVGQDESILGKTISKDSDGYDELGGIIKHMEPSLKHEDGSISKVGDGLETGLQIGEIPEKISELKDDLSGDHFLVQDVFRRHEFNPSADGSLKVPNTRSTDLPERDESKDGEQIVANENQVEASVDQFVENSEQVDKFASGSQVDTVIPSVQNTCASGAFLESQETTHLKNNIVDGSVDLSQEVHIDGENLIESAVASVTLHVQKHSALDMQSRDDGHAIGNSTRSTVSEPSDSKLKENSDFPIVEECSEGLGVETPLQSGISKDIVLSVGNDITPKPFVGDTTLKDQESETSNTDTQISVSQESTLGNLDSMVQIACDAVEKKDLSESDCHSDMKILCSKSEKNLLSVEDGKGSQGEGDGSHNTLGAELMRVDEEHIVTEHTDHYKFDQSVSAAEKLNTELTSDSSKTDCEEGGSPIIMKGIDSSSFDTVDCVLLASATSFPAAASAAAFDQKEVQVSPPETCFSIMKTSGITTDKGGTANELASNLQSDVAISGKSVDCVLLASGTSFPAADAFDQKEIQVSPPETSFSIMKTSGITTDKGEPCETDGQSSGKKVDRSFSMEDTSAAVGQSGDQTLQSVTLEAVKDMHASSIVSDSIVRESDGAEAQVISKKGSSGPSDAVSNQEKNKTLTNSVPSTSKELSLPEDSDRKLLSEEISGHIVAHHADGDNVKTHNSSFPSAPSSKIHMMERGSSSADLDNPSCGSLILVRTSEQPESEIETHTGEGSKNLSASVSGVISGEANKVLSISQNTNGNDASSGDKSFTFEVPPMENLSEKEASRNWQPFSAVQHDKISLVVEGTPSTSGLTKVGPETAEKVSPSNLQAFERENVSGGSKGTSERRTRRAGSKSSGKEAAKKRIVAKDTSPAKQSKRSRRTSNASLSTAEIGQPLKSNEMPHFGNSEVLHQPFTDLQQVQLRAQIFVYGSLIQGSAPDEPYMISAFGGPDGGRKWENVWQAYKERVHYPKSHLFSPEIPLQAHIGAKTPDQSIKQNALQAKITSSPASQSNSRDTPTTIGKPMIPLSSPLWTIPTPSSDAFQPSSIRRGTVVDYQKAFSPLHPPPTKNFVGHTTPWMSQFPFHVPWVPQSSDGNAQFPALPITEAVNLTPAREASVPNSSVMKQVSAVPMVQSGSLTNVFAGTPLLDNNKATFRPGHHSADPKPRKRKKSTVSEDPVQIILCSQTESLLATLVNSHASTTASITTPATIVSKLPTEKSVTSLSADHLESGGRDLDQKATLSEETLGKLKEAQKLAEDAASLAASAVCHSQEIWNQLDKQKDYGLAPDVEIKLTSAAVAIAAAAAVAKAAAAAANVASNAALQAKLMFDEALVSSGCGNPISTNAISFDSSKNLGKATPASILRGEKATSSNSVIVAAKEASRRRVEAASAASKRAENMDAIVKAAELAADAVSQAGKIVMGEPFTLTELVEAGPEAYWKVPHATSEPDDAIREHGDKGGNVEAPGSFGEHQQEVPKDKREEQSNNNEMSPILQEMTRESMQDHSRLTDSILCPAATSGNDKKGQKGRKASDIGKSKRVSTKTEHGKAEETSKDNNMSEGSHVEVLRDGGGLKVAWFLADILDLKDGKAYVCYNDIRSEDGNGLKEWVDLEGEGDRAPRIRSARPITVMPIEGTRKRRRAAMGDYNWSVGDRVDSWMQDSWWEGIINEKNMKDETSFTVHFPAQGETSIVKAWLLRPSLMWKDGNWVEWSSSGDNSGSSCEGDTPLEKRPRIGSHVAETKEEGTKGFDNKESEKPDDTRLVDLSVGGIFNIGKCTRDESKPGSLRTKRSGLKKEGSRVIFGVPKPGKKRKFMDVSKHYVADQNSKTRRTNNSAKFSKGSESRGTKYIIVPKENRMTVSRPKVLKSGKPPSVSSRTIPQKDSLSSNVGSEPDDTVTADAENILEKHNVEFRSVSNSDEVAEGPVIFSFAALSSDAHPEEASASKAKSGRIRKGKLALSPGKSAKVYEEMRTAPEASEPRRSNRKIQPTSRLLEGLQSSLIISKVPVSHDKGHKGQNRSARGNDEDQD